MLNIMQASLLSLHVNGYIHTSLSDSPQEMASNELQTVQADYLQETTVKGCTKFRLIYHSCHI
jgi:hypothetical protein